MTYQVIFSGPIDKTKDVGENIFLDNLPSDYAVYLFYYPGAVRDDDLENRLRDFGEITGKNLLVNIGHLNDPSFGKMVEMFKIERFPVLIMTAVDNLASSNTELLTAYVRMDSSRIFTSPEFIIKCLQGLFNMFIIGSISEAMVQAKKNERKALISQLKTIVINSLKGIGDFIKEIDISVSLTEGKFELRSKGG